MTCPSCSNTPGTLTVGLALIHQPTTDLILPALTLNGLSTCGTTYYAAARTLGFCHTHASRIHSSASHTMTTQVLKN